MAPDPADPMLQLPTVMADQAATLVVAALPALGALVLAVLVVSVLVRVIRAYAR